MIGVATIERSKSDKMGPPSDVSFRVERGELDGPRNIEDVLTAVIFFGF